MKENEKILSPKIHESVYIADGAKIVGDVEIGKGCSIWFNAVIRGDEGKITIGENTNIQDNCVLHSDDGAVVEIGDSITIGHGAVIRGCRIGNNTMVGMNATLMSGAVIGEESIVGANTFIPYNKEIPPRSIVVGAPARVVGPVKGDAAKVNQNGVRIYKELVGRYQRREILNHETSS